MKGGYVLDKKHQINADTTPLSRIAEADKFTIWFLIRVEECRSLPEFGSGIHAGKQGAWKLL